LCSNPFVDKSTQIELLYPNKNSVFCIQLQPP